MDFVGDQTDANDDFVTPKKPETNVQEQQPNATKSKVARVGHAAKEYWYILAVVVVVAGVAVVFAVIQQNQSHHWAKAQDYFSRADYEKAAKELQGLSMPSDETRLVVYSRVMHATANNDPTNTHYKNALAAYEKLYAMHKDPQVKILMANIYIQQKQYEQAAKMLNEVIAANPSFIQAYSNLATMYRVQGNNKQAIVVAKKGIDANPKDGTLRELLVGLLLDEKGSAAYNDAVTQLKTVYPSSHLLESLKQ